MFFDFTPDPKILIALTHTAIKPIDAISELIDNAIDSFHSAKIQGIEIENPMVFLTLPTRSQLSQNTGVLRIQDNGPGMSADNAEKAIRAGFSGNNPYDTLGLFGMGFNISTGKLGNRTVLYTSQKGSSKYLKATIDLEQINKEKSYQIPAEECTKGDDQPFGKNAYGTIIEISEWWPEGTSNYGFVQKLVNMGANEVRRQIGRRYATILRDKDITIFVNNEKTIPYEFCCWDETRYVEKNHAKIKAKYQIDQVVGTYKRCGECTALLGPDDEICPSCGSTRIRTIDERVKGWVGIQRFDDEVKFGIDLIRNGRAIRVAEKDAFFNYVGDDGEVIKDYPIDQQYGRIIGEVHLDFVPVDFMKDDFQRTSDQWRRAIALLRGESSFQPSKQGIIQNDSVVCKLFQGYRRVRDIGLGDMYMGRFDPVKAKAKRIEREVEKEYYQRFLRHEPGYYDDAEWWKLVETAEQPPVEEMVECRECGAQNPKDAEACMVCGYALKTKKCLECNKDIPISTEVCPYCEKSQVPQIIEPWTCNVCGTRNIATDTVCCKCGNSRGSANPLSEESLRDISRIIEELSIVQLQVLYADGSKSAPVDVNAYVTSGRIVSYKTGKPMPVIVYKHLGEMNIFVDIEHSFFTKCDVSKQQFIAAEIAEYLYTEKLAIASAYPEHNLGNLTWQVLTQYWKTDIELDSDVVMADALSLLNEIREKLTLQLGTNGTAYYDELDHEELKLLTESMVANNIDLDSISELKGNGGFIRYAPYSFILKIFKDDPDVFFGGKIWNVKLSGESVSLLGEENVERARNKIIHQYLNYLQDVLLFIQNKYTDTATVQRTRLSVQFLRRKMTT